MSPETSPPETLRRRRLALALVVVASVIAFLAIFAVWVNRQALETEEWTQTSSELLEKPVIRTAVATYLVDELYSNVDVAAELQARLPKEAKPLAGPLAGGLREFAQRAAVRALESPRVQLAWEDANRQAHKEFVAVVEDKGSAAVTTAGGDVVLHLRPLVESLAQYLGLGGKLAGKLPPDAGDLVIMRSNQLDAAQKVTNLIRGLAIVLPLLWLALAALAVYLARGRRRQTIRSVALGAVAGGILALLARGAAGDMVTNALAKTAAVKPAIDATWSVSTSLLTDVSQSVIAIGILLLLVAWLAGSTRPAVAFRRAAAPYMRERPDLVYGVVAVLFLVLVAWHPADVFKRPLALLLIGALMIVGTEALRNQTEEEFPDATLGGAGIRDSIRSWRAGLSRSSSGGAPSAEETRLERLERLNTLRERGALSQEEFEAQKAALLG
jgi:putative oligomerization/nucleic acid binding protein